MQSIDLWMWRPATSFFIFLYSVVVAVADVKGETTTARHDTAVAVESKADTKHVT